MPPVQKGGGEPHFSVAKLFTMANVTFKNITKAYDKSVIAVDNFNLEINDREFVVFVGPSGCGKSTTLRMVAGLEEITTGEFFIDGNLVNTVPPKDRDIAMVFQNYALYPHMTVYENLAFALKIKNEKKEIIDQKVNQAAEILGITPLLKRKPKALSGGQRQRVAIGRAIVRHPKVFLMDEPLSNLDAKLRNQMRTEIIKLRERVDTTFIYVTHDQTEAMTLGDRIVIMKDGHIQQIGASQEVYEKPANKFVAGFIGTPQMNFLPAELVFSGGKYSIHTCGVKIDPGADTEEILRFREQGPGKVTLGIRPEHVRVVPEGTPGSISAEVDVCEMMGGEMHLHLSVGTSDVIIRVSTEEITDSGKGQKKHNTVCFVIPGRLAHLFDTETEKSLLF